MDPEKEAEFKSEIKGLNWILFFGLFGLFRDILDMLNSEEVVPFNDWSFSFITICVYFIVRQSITRSYSRAEPINEPLDEYSQLQENLSSFKIILYVALLELFRQFVGAAFIDPEPTVKYAGLGLTLLAGYIICHLWMSQKLRRLRSAGNIAHGRNELTDLNPNNKPNNIWTVLGAFKSTRVFLLMGVISICIELYLAHLTKTPVTWITYAPGMIFLGLGAIIFVFGLIEPLLPKKPSPWRPTPTNYIQMCASTFASKMSVAMNKRASCQHQYLLLVRNIF